MKENGNNGNDGNYAGGGEGGMEQATGWNSEQNMEQNSEQNLDERAIERRLNALRIDATEHVAKVDLPGGTFRMEDREEAKRLLAQKTAILRRKAYQEWLESEPGKLCAELYRKFQEYLQFLEKNGWARDRGRDFPEHAFFKMGLQMFMEAERALANDERDRLEHARQAARCEHVHENGERCGCPRLKGRKLCYMHERAEAARALKLDLGPMEDPDSMQLAFKRLQKAVIDETLSDKQIRHLTNILQVATWNVTRLTFAKRLMAENS